jgi:hypothetical protein
MLHACNIFIALAATAFFVLFAALMLGHRLLWPVIARPLYLVTSERLLTHRTALCASVSPLSALHFRASLRF